MKDSSEFRKLVAHFFRRLPGIIFSSREAEDKKIMYMKDLRYLGLRVMKGEREKITNLK
jgi:hypothetical protein